MAAHIPPEYTSRDLVTLDDYESTAREVLLAEDGGGAGVLGYFAAGACDEETLREGPASFSQLRLRPRVLVDVRESSVSHTLLGVPMEAPFGIAPTAFHALLHPDGEVATARAAGAAGIAYCCSAMSTTAMETVAAAYAAGAAGRVDAAAGQGDAAAASPPPRKPWVQLYFMEDRAVTRAFVERAERCGGFGALVLTVDRPVLGRRETDVRTGFDVPFAVHRDPNGLCGGAGSALAGARVSASLTWQDVAWLRSVTQLPLVLKGVIAAEDAARAVAAGCAAVWVSTHGGRQLDSSVSALHALPGVVHAVRAADAARAAAGDAASDAADAADAAAGAPPRVPRRASSARRTEVYLDGGVRRGTDVVKGIALGADFVFVGRPPVWGLAVAGEAGVRDVLRILREELLTAVALIGAPRVRDIAPEHVVHRTMLDAGRSVLQRPPSL